MANLYTSLTVVVLALTLALVSAEPSRFRSARRNGALRFSARQEELPVEDSAPAAAPYPAAGVTPEVPFDLPTETETPAATPDETYGPPDSAYGPPAQAGAEEDGEPAVPDNTYGPPEDTLAAGEPAETDLVSQNLIQPRNKRVRTSSRIRAAPVRLRAAPRSANIVEIIRSEPVLVYTLQ